MVKEVALVALCLSGSASVSGAPVPIEATWIGVNLAGGEFGRAPGVHGKDYIYPGAAQFDYCQRKGMKILRVPFAWERLQPVLMAPLATAEVARLDDVVALARERELKLLLDMHNYARYNGDLIGTDAVPNVAFVDVWRRLAEHYRDSEAVFAYGLMNEPHDTQGLWPAAAQACVDGIRRVDARHTLVVCGDAWSGAHSWRDANASFLLNDPADNLVYEAHQYFDQDSSGTYRKSYDDEKAYPGIGVDRLRPFAAWLREHGVRGFIGEFGIPDNDPRWLVVLDGFLAAMREQGIGGTYWAAGPWWGTYALCLEPRNGEDRPQMAVIDTYLGLGTVPEVRPWLAAAEAAEKEALQRRQEDRAKGRPVHDFGSQKESYHYSNEGSEFASSGIQEGGRELRQIAYKHVGEIAWIGIGVYFGALDCRDHGAFILEVRAEKPCRLEVKAYTTDGKRYSGFFELNSTWQDLRLPFKQLTLEGLALDARERVEKIEFQPSTDRDGSHLTLGRLRLDPTP